MASSTPLPHLHWSAISTEMRLFLELSLLAATPKHSVRFRGLLLRRLALSTRLLALLDFSWSLRTLIPVLHYL